MATNESTLGQALDRFLEDSQLIEQALVQRVIAEWAEIAGQPLADQTEALWYKDHVFYLQLRSPLWKHEVSYGRSRLVGHINRHVGRDLARELRLV